MLYLLWSNVSGFIAVKKIIESYIHYIKTVKRYSARTVDIYSEVLEEYCRFAQVEECDEADSFLTHNMIRSYEVHLLEKRRLKVTTVNQHLSVLSAFAKWLMRENLLSSNPVSLVKRPKNPKRLPEFFKEDSMEEYFRSTEHCADEESLELFLSYFGPDGNASSDSAHSLPEACLNLYQARLGRITVSMLSGCGLRRSELLGANLGDYDFRRKVLRVKGKGDKTREIPLTDSLAYELQLYLRAAEALSRGSRPADAPLLVKADGSRLYPVFVDRLVKSELSGVYSMTGKKSPHVLRHTLATELLNSGTDLNSIKELLGHSSLAATQVYTHNSIAKLKAVYRSAHPRSGTEKK